MAPEVRGLRTLFCVNSFVFGFWLLAVTPGRADAGKAGKPSKILRHSHAYGVGTL